MHVQFAVQIDPVGQEYPISHCSPGSITPFAQREEIAMLEEEKAELEKTAIGMEETEELAVPPTHRQHSPEQEVFPQTEGQCKLDGGAQSKAKERHSFPNNFAVHR